MHPGRLRRGGDPDPVPHPPDPCCRPRCDWRRPMTAVAAREALAIPTSHLDLLTRPICAVLTTMGADGQPQSSLVWVDHDGEAARVNTTLERQKGRNLAANSKVSLLVVDPDNAGRFIQIRGDAELLTEGALEHVDALTRKYTRHPRY